jgi:hypothetical protein
MSIYAVVKEAAKHGRAEVLDWALAHQRWGDSLNSIQHLDTVLLSRSIELVQLDAVASGDLHVLGRLLALDAPRTRRRQLALTCMAATHGHASALEWLRQPRPIFVEVEGLPGEMSSCAWNLSSWLAAAAFGRVEVLQLLKREDCPTTRHVDDEASSAMHGTEQFDCIYTAIICGRDDRGLGGADDVRNWPSWDVPLEGNIHLGSASFKGDPINRISWGCPGRREDFVQLCVRSREADQATVTVLELVHSTCLFKLPSTRSEVRDHTCELAAATGSALCLEWLLAHGWRNGPRTSHFAAKICALPVLEALARHGIGFSQLTWRCANRKSWSCGYDGVAIADAERKVRAPLLKSYSPYLLSHYSYLLSYSTVPFLNLHCRSSLRGLPSMVAR